MVATQVSTAANAGYLDIKMVPERHNNVKVLLLMDVGGSMHPYIRLCSQLFSAVNRSSRDKPPASSMSSGSTNP